MCRKIVSKFVVRFFLTLRCKYDSDHKSTLKVGVISSISAKKTQIPTYYCVKVYSVRLFYVAMKWNCCEFLVYTYYYIRHLILFILRGSVFFLGSFSFAFLFQVYGTTYPTLVCTLSYINYWWLFFRLHYNIIFYS